MKRGRGRPPLARKSTTQTMTTAGPTTRATLAALATTPSTSAPTTMPAVVTTPPLNPNLVPAHLIPLTPTVPQSATEPTVPLAAITPCGGGSGAPAATPRAASETGGDGAAGEKEGEEERMVAEATQESVELFASAGAEVEFASTVDFGVDISQAAMDAVASQELSC